MHELSLARSLLRLVVEHCPPQSRVTQVQVEAGPLQAIDPTALDWAWQAVRLDEPQTNDAELLFRELPWRLRCPDCGRVWNDASLDVVCRCGSYGAYPEGCDALHLTGLEIESEGEPRASSRC